MFVAFFESVKYIGHLFPVAILRIYLGYYYLQQASVHYNGDFLLQPQLSAQINEWLPQNQAPLWYAHWLETSVIPNWKFFAYLITYCEFLIGISLIIGFLVRPSTLLGMVLSWAFIYIGGQSVELHKIFFALFITLFWLGAGRCLGFDYFFYKRQRGIWW